MTTLTTAEAVEAAYEEAAGLHYELERALTLLDVAHQLVWTAEGEGPDTTPRMKRILTKVVAAQDEIQGVLTDLHKILERYDPHEAPTAQTNLVVIH